MTAALSSSKLVVYWLWSGIALILIMVLIGGMTRLTHSGLSMVHWTFVGSLPPMSETEWTAEFEHYQQSPEFKEVHGHFELEEFKSIFWWEFSHRMFGRMIGLVFIFPFLFFLWKKYIPKKLLPQFLIILGLGTLQALLGWFMVKSGLIDVPRVSHYRLAAHLVTAFITCAYIFWVTLNYKDFGKLNRYESPFRNQLIVFGIFLLIQIIFGAFVAGLRAGWIHNTWPLMDGALIAPSVTTLDPTWLNFFEGKSGVQFVHRTLGLIVLTFGIWLGWGSKVRFDSNLRNPVQLLSMVIFMQFLLGVSTLLFEVPISLAVIHQVFALIALLTLVWAWHRAIFIEAPH
jgi:heme a synthase